MEQLEKVLAISEDEIRSIADSGRYRTKDDVDLMYKLIDIAKDVYCIWAYEEQMAGGMSSAGSYYREGGSNRGSYYEDGAYERRGRGRGARRDSMGRYREGGSSYRDGSMRRGSYYRDGGKEEFTENLKALMEEAPDEQTKQGIERLLQQM